MPNARCSGCGYTTNSCTSNYWATDGSPTECYARFQAGKWFKGCAYDRADYSTKISVDNLLKSKQPMSNPKDIEVGD